MPLCNGSLQALLCGMSRTKKQYRKRGSCRQIKLHITLIHSQMASLSVMGQERSYGPIQQPSSSLKCPLSLSAEGETTRSSFIAMREATSPNEPAHSSPGSCTCLWMRIVMATWHIRSQNDHLRLPDQSFPLVRNSIEGRGVRVPLAPSERKFQSCKINWRFLAECT